MKNTKHDPTQYCKICKNNHPFDLPDEIIEAAKSENLAIFAGAGISTENKNVFIETLYEDLKYDLEIPQEEDIDFPNLVSRYCKQINGKKKFLQKVKTRFDYVHQYSENYLKATQFHKELSTIFSIKTIITTNWDDYFEKECAAIPIVTPENFAFYDTDERKVFKIHGSINNYGTLIASKEDYDKCYESLKTGIIGSFLKTILATKVVVFIGYSFRDYDFINIYNYLKTELKDVLPHIYIVTTNKNIGENIKNFPTSTIHTDGTFFLSTLKKHLVKDKFLLPDHFYEKISIYKQILIKTHCELFKKYNMGKYPNLLYCASYQDGIIHAFDYLLFMRNSGKTSSCCHVRHSIHLYEKK